MLGEAETFDPTRYVIDRVDEGEFLVHRGVFTEPDIFERELRDIFEKTWIFLCHECQIPDRHDYFQARIGRQPVVVMRNGKGRIGGFINACAHKGNTVCRRISGNSAYHTCPYHGWVYDSDGRCVVLRDREAGQYSDAFDRLDHGLTRLPQLESYRGFVFGCLDRDAPPLDEYLGDAKLFIDLVIDQSPNGIELIPGNSTFTYRGNWKMQVENCSDSYHVAPLHTSYNTLVAKRRAGESKHSGVDAANFDDFVTSENRGGSFGFPYGHSLYWGENPAPWTRPIFAMRDEIESRVGRERAKWMLYIRQLTIFPTFQLAETASLQLRVIEPVAADRTDMRTYCIAPVGESAETRYRRLRQYEDFFNMTGMATPDDTITYEGCQIGYQGRLAKWQQGYARGIPRLQAGPDDAARSLGIDPLTSISGPVDMQEETVFHATYREWMRRLAGQGHDHPV